MKKFMAAALISALMIPALGLAQDMVSVSELYAQAQAMGGRWIGTYETKRGTVAVDAPIIVPDVEQMPVITVERARPLTQEWFDALEAEGRTKKGKNQLEYRTEVEGKDVKLFLGYEENGLSGYDAVHALWATHGEYIEKGLLGPIEPRSDHCAWDLDPSQPFARGTDMTVNGAMALLRQDLERFYPNDEIEVHPKEIEIKGSILTQNPDKGKKWRVPGEYKLYFVEQYMGGVPIFGEIGSQIGGNHFSISYTATRETNRKSDQLNVYRTGTRACAPQIDVYAQSEENYRVDAEVSRLRSVEIADVPLAPLDEVMANVEKLIDEGKIQSINSLRLGYLLYSNPDMTDHAWAVPRWVLDCTYESRENRGFEDKRLQMPIDAQSADPIIVTIGDEATFSVPALLTWDDVN